MSLKIPVLVVLQALQGVQVVSVAVPDSQPDSPEYSGYECHRYSTERNFAANDLDTSPYEARFKRLDNSWLPIALENLNGCVSSAQNDGLVPPTKLAIDKSRTFLEFLAKRIGSEPDVYPMGEADVAIDFCAADGRSNVLFVVDDDGSAAVFLCVDGDGDSYSRVDDATDFQDDAVDRLSGAGIT